MSEMTNADVVHKTLQERGWFAHADGSLRKGLITWAPMASDRARSVVYDCGNRYNEVSFPSRVHYSVVVATCEAMAKAEGWA